MKMWPKLKLGKVGVGSKICSKSWPQIEHPRGSIVEPQDGFNSLSYNGLKTPIIIALVCMPAYITGGLINQDIHLQFTHARTCAHAHTDTTYTHAHVHTLTQQLKQWNSYWLKIYHNVKKFVMAPKIHHDVKKLVMMSKRYFHCQHI